MDRNYSILEVNLNSPYIIICGMLCGIISLYFQGFEGNSLALYFERLQYLSILSFIDSGNTYSTTQYFHKNSLGTIFFQFVSLSQFISISKSGSINTISNFDPFINASMDIEYLLINIFRVIPLIALFYSIYFCVKIINKVKKFNLISKLKKQLKYSGQIRLFQALYLHAFLISFYQIINVS